MMHTLTPYKFFFLILVFLGLTFGLVSLSAEEQLVEFGSQSEFGELWKRSSIFLVVPACPPLFWSLIGVDGTLGGKFFLTKVHVWQTTKRICDINLVDWEKWTSKIQNLTRRANSIEALHVNIQVVTVISNPWTLLVNPAITWVHIQEQHHYFWLHVDKFHKETLAFYQAPGLFQCPLQRRAKLTPTWIFLLNTLFFLLFTLYK